MCEKDNIYICVHNCINKTELVKTSSAFYHWNKLNKAVTDYKYFWFTDVIKYLNDTHLNNFI